MKNFVQIVLVAVMVLAVGAGGSRAENWKVFTDSKGIEWEYEEIEAGKTCQIRCSDALNLNEDIAIPGKVTDNGIEIKVVKIADNAFFGSGITSVTIPDGVEAIGKEAFIWCGELTAVSIPNSVSVIGQSAFSGCKKIESVNLSGVKDIGEGAFRTTGLTKVTIPGGVKSIANETFSECEKLETVTLPEGVESIGRSAFNGCSALTAVKLPGSVKTIGADAFSYCTSLQTFAFPPLVEKIASITLFSCSALKSVTISSGVKTIEEDAFGNCDSLERFEVDKDNQTYAASADGVLFSKDKRTLILYPQGKEGIYRVPDGVEAIAENAFEYCRKLKGVALPESLQSIGRGAFYSCESLTEITIPEGVTVIRSYTFSKCNKLQSVTLPEKLDTIGISAFDNCSSLKEITIPRHTEFIGQSAFLGCTSFEAIYWLPDASIKLEPSPFNDVHSVTLCVRKGEKEKIKKANLQMVERGGFKDTVEGYLVTFADGNSVLFERLVEPNGRVKHPANPKKKWHKFLGWMLDNKPYDFTSPMTKDITLVAKWEEIPYFRVYFDSNGGPAVPEQKVAPGKKAKEPDTLIREGYRFAGWMLDGNPYNFDTPVTKDIELVAKWEKIYFTVRFDSNGGSAVPTQEVAWGEKAKEPDTITREGYRFAGWMLGDKLYDFNTPVTKDIKLVAKWEARTAVESELLAAARVTGNPVGDALALEGVAAAERVEVYSVRGAAVASQALRGEAHVELNAGGWASGVYMVRLVARDGARTLRFVKL